MNRTGKIARLPHTLREQLNQRLQNGEASEPLLAWLNRQPKVKTILKKQFAGVPISKQNLSEWRKGGYVEWEFKQDIAGDAEEINTDGWELDQSTSGYLADNLGVILTARYASLVHHWHGEVTDALRAQLKVLDGMIQKVSQLRRADQGAAKVRLAINQRTEKLQAAEAKATAKPAPRRSAIPTFQFPSWDPPSTSPSSTPSIQSTPSTQSLPPTEPPKPLTEVPAPSAPEPAPQAPEPCPPSNQVKPNQGTLIESTEPAATSKAVNPEKVTPKPTAPKPRRTTYDVWPEHVAGELDEYTLRRLPNVSRPATEVMPKTIYDSQRGTFAILTEPDQPNYPGSLRWGKGLPPEQRPYRPTLCRGKCNLADGSCTGCQRTEDEITLWPVLNRPERVAYIHKILERRLVAGLIK